MEQQQAILFILALPNRNCLGVGWEKAGVSLLGRVGRLVGRSTSLADCAKGGKGKRRKKSFVPEERGRPIHHPPLPPREKKKKRAKKKNGRKPGNKVAATGRFERGKGCLLPGCWSLLSLEGSPLPPLLPSASRDGEKERERSAAAAARSKRREKGSQEM